MEIVLGVLMLIVAILGYRVAILQKQLNERQVNFDSFDRNFRIYKIIEGFINKIISGRISLNDPTDFDNEVKEAKYIYDDNVIKFIEKIRSIGIELALLNNEIKMLTGIQDMSADELIERKGHMSRKSSIIKDAFINLPTELNSLFDPILKPEKK